MGRALTEDEDTSAGTGAGTIDDDEDVTEGMDMADLGESRAG